MKKWWIVILITGVVGLSACGTEETGKTEEKKSEEKSAQETTSAEEKTEENSGEEKSSENDENNESNDNSGQELAEQLKVESDVETSGKKAAISFSLTNEGEEAVEAGFMSGQQFDVRITDRNGESVYTYSADRSFTQAKTAEQIEPGQRIENAVEWEENVMPGDYEATAAFLVNTVNGEEVKDMEFTSTTSFTIEEQEEPASEESDGQQEETAPEESESADGEEPEKGKEEETPAPSEPSSSVGGNDAFRDLELSGESGNYTVSGEARVSEGDFFYRVEDGHNELIPETAVQVDAGAPNWSEFELTISIPSSDLPDTGALTLMIYDSGEDNAPAHVNYVPLDRFGGE